jgi:hypothetical protein
MDVPPRKVAVVFYRTPAGAEGVRDWLKGLAEEDRALIGQDLMRVQFRWPVGMPLCRPLGDGLWGVRGDLPSNRIARVLLFHGGAASRAPWDHQENAEDAGGRS